MSSCYTSALGLSLFLTLLSFSKNLSSQVLVNSPTEKLKTSELIDLNDISGKYVTAWVKVPCFSPSKLYFHLEFGQEKKKRKSFIRESDKSKKNFVQEVNLLNFMDKNGWKPTLIEGERILFERSK